MIYFAQIKGGGAIKIGTTIQLNVRLAQLRCETRREFVVLGILPGSYAEENVLHRRFSRIRHYGEWFKPAPELMDFIAKETSPWDGVDERTFSSAQIDAEVLRAARIVAAYEDVQLSELISEILRPILAKRLERHRTEEPSRKPQRD